MSAEAPASTTHPKAQSKPATVSQLSVKIKSYPPNPEPPLPSLFNHGYPRNIYPYNRRESQTRKSAMADMRVVRLANEYIEVDILPDLGGHVWGAKDLVSGREMFHRTDALKHQDLAVGGAWIATGIEFNFPVSHALHTIEKINCVHGVEENGAAWVRIGATDKLFGLLWQMTLRLRPGIRALEIDGWLHNPSDLEHPYWYWDNAGITTDESLRLYYPFKYCEHHGGKLFKWPHDNNTDLSYWKNCSQPISAFGDCGDKRFFGGYYEAFNFGVVHTADPYQLPGKKYFAWGNGPTGVRWGKLLSENLRDYVELQSGTRNDQEFWSCLDPHSTVRFHERWQPIDAVGGITDANELLTVFVGQEKGSAVVRAQSVEPLKAVKFRAYTDKGEVESWEADLSPTVVHTRLLTHKGPVKLDVDTGVPDMKLSTCDVALTDYGPAPKTREEVRDPVERSAVNFRAYAKHALQSGTWADAWIWYEAALKLAPDDQATLEEAGLFRLSRHEYADAKKLLLDVLAKGRNSKALIWGLLRAAWRTIDTTLESQLLARMSGEEQRLAAVLTHLHHRRPAEAARAAEGSSVAELIANRDLGIAALVARRLSGKPDAALLSAMSKQYPLDPVLCFERHDGSLEKLFESDADVAVTVADVLLQLGDGPSAAKAIEQKAAWRKGWQVSDLALAEFAGSTKYTLNQDAAFDPLAERPWQDSFFDLLPALIVKYPKDARLHYLWGNLLQRCGRTPEALKAWEQSERLGGDWPALHLAIALVQSDPVECTDADVDRLAAISKSINNHIIDAYYYRVLQHSGRRERLLEVYRERLKSKDFDENITRRYTQELVAHGRFDEALEYMLKTDHPATHGGSKLTFAHIRCRIVRGRKLLREKRYDEARKELEQAFVIQHNFNEDAQNLHFVAEAYCVLGDLEKELGNSAKAKEWYLKAAHEDHDLHSQFRLWQAIGMIKSGLNPKEGERSIKRLGDMIELYLSIPFDNHWYWRYLKSTLLAYRGDEVGAQRELDAAFKTGLDYCVW